MFCVKDVLTATLRWSDRPASRLGGNGRAKLSKYVTIVRAIIESAVVTWIGIVLCEIGLLAPTGHITVSAIFFLWFRGRPLKEDVQTDQNMGTVILNIIPDFFVRYLLSLQSSTNSRGLFFILF